jgi:hypothetical protein
MVTSNSLSAIGRTAGVLVRLLFVEDVETDAELAVRRLHLDGVQCIGEERAIEALRCGAVDYVLKSNLKRLAPGTRTARPCTWAGEGGELMSSLMFAIAANAEDDSSVTGRARPCNCVTYPATTLA